MKGRYVVLALLGAVAGVVAIVVAGGTELPEGPVPIAWDREPCAHCHMQIGEPRHAVQLVTTEARVLDFDDVGCAIAYLKQHKPGVHRLWFHGEGDTWLGAEVVGFVKTDITPMGSGLLAVERRSADAQSLEDVLQMRLPNGAQGTHGVTP
jgi:hypothetical protein